MKILLVDVDSKIPNLALMKISSYYKKKYGAKVVLKRLGYSYYPYTVGCKRYNKKEYVINETGYHRIFVSCIFNTNKNYIKIKSDNVEIGGTGFDYKIILHDDIENCKPDYSIYPDNEFSYGFLTRGCIRNCYFCVVPEKEGKLRKVNDIDDIIRHDKIRFLDNNFLAYKEHKKILEELGNLKTQCKFYQGLDIRLIDDENAYLLSKLKYEGEYIFAFDDLKYEDIINEKLKILKKYIKSKYVIKFFIYCHPNHDIKNDIIYRIEWCKRNEVLPYLMRDISCWDSEYDYFYKDLATYCNQPKCFKNMTFIEFLYKYHYLIKRISKERLLTSKYIYETGKILKLKNSLW